VTRLPTNVTAEDIEAGRNLLARPAAQDKIKGRVIRLLHVYSQAELAELVMDAGFNVLESCLSLASSRW